MTYNPTSKEIDKAVQNFLARGGEITILPPVGAPPNYDSLPHASPETLAHHDELRYAKTEGI